MQATETIEELRRRFNPEAARNLFATYLFTIRGQDGGCWLARIKDGTVEFTPHDAPESAAPPSDHADCIISVAAEDLQMIMSGQMSAMTAALSGVLAIEGELGLAIQLVPIFFEGQAPFI